MSIRSEQPPTVRRKAQGTWPELDAFVEKAMVNRGEWFAVDVPNSIKGTSVSTRIRSAVWRHLDGIEVGNQNGVAYLRIRENL